jgi:hypothetical protein
MVHACASDCTNMNADILAQLYDDVSAAPADEEAAVGPESRSDGRCGAERSAVPCARAAGVDAARCADDCALQDSSSAACTSHGTSSDSSSGASDVDAALPAAAAALWLADARTAIRLLAVAAGWEWTADVMIDALLWPAAETLTVDSPGRDQLLSLVADLLTFVEDFASDCTAAAACVARIREGMSFVV